MTTNTAPPSLLRPGVINALRSHRPQAFATSKVVVNGAGAAGIACLELLKAMGLPNGNAILCDTKGVIYRGRTSGMNQWKSAHASIPSARTLADALMGCDVFLGLSVKGAVSQEMVKTMAKAPIVFAMANPDPEITPEDVKAVRPDAIVATGRSDYPNQVNNVLGFPYIFRGALDVRAETINEAMKIAAAEALAALAREDVPDEVAAAYRGARPVYGPDYIIPVPFDPRLISRVSSAVAEAAVKSGVARRELKDVETYRRQLTARLDPSALLFQRVTASVRAKPKRVVFAEGEEDSVIRAAAAFQSAGLGRALLIGREEIIKAGLRRAGIDEHLLEIRVPHSAQDAAPYIEALYNRLQRRGHLYRDCARLVTNDRNIFAASMLKAGDADAMVTGVTRSYQADIERHAHGARSASGRRPIGVMLIFTKGRVCCSWATPRCTRCRLAKSWLILRWRRRRWRGSSASHRAWRCWLPPPSAFPATNAANASWRRSTFWIDAAWISNMTAKWRRTWRSMPEKLALYPFCRLTDTANALIMPAIHSASISTKLLQEAGDVSVLGPLLIGLEKSVQIAPLGAKMSEIYNAAMIAAL